MSKPETICERKISSVACWKQLSSFVMGREDDIRPKPQTSNLDSIGGFTTLSRGQLAQIQYRCYAFSLHWSDTMSMTLTIGILLTFTCRSLNKSVHAMAAISLPCLNTLPFFARQWHTTKFVSQRKKSVHNKQILIDYCNVQAEGYVLHGPSNSKILEKAGQRYQVDMSRI